MIAFPNCKINLGLNIIAKRSDGYHDLETVFYPLPLKDIAELIAADKETQFSVSGLKVKGTTEENLCFKAYGLLKKDFPQLPPVKMHLHKVIPMGAGLGGGSADGAFTISLINKKFNLGLSDDKLSQYAMQLGSDCPFFIKNKPCFATGRGEILEQIDLDLSAYKIVVVHPSIHINTAWAFSVINPKSPIKSIREIIKQPVSSWKNELRNDFEEPVFLKFPEIKNIRDIFYNAGAVYASMTGSGSAVFGIFKREEKVSFKFPGNYFVKELAG
jgi:4-diphosphocytidyl-2-C-methyl-D-erythritol kinase